MEKLRRIIIGSNASIFQKIDPDSNIKVFAPTSELEINEAITFARENNLPITTKGGGSGLSGACTGASRKKVVISAMRLKKVLELNFKDGYAVVEPGITPDELNEIIQQQKANWKFFIAPSSRDIATLGGILSTDGGGNDAWLAGTMVDNVLAVELIDYNNNKIIVEQLEDQKDKLKVKITSENKELEKKLQEANFSLMDIAGSHGVLGFISKIKVEIKALPDTGELSYAFVHCDNLNAFGKVIYDLIENDIPLTYGESIVQAEHPDIATKTNPPMFIFEYPRKYNDKMIEIIKNIPSTTFSEVDLEEFEMIKDIRINLAKRNPPEGYQIALFEGYGIYGENLLRFEEMIKEINETLGKYRFLPFIKYGHAPSLWHVGNEKIKGLIMHSREIRPTNFTQDLVFNGIVDLVETCERLGITPKPEHKWPFSKTTVKHKRLTELTKLLGANFNPFLLDCTLEELSEMVL